MFLAYRNSVPIHEILRFASYAHRLRAVPQASFFSGSPPHDASRSSAALLVCCSFFALGNHELQGCRKLAWRDRHGHAFGQ